MAWSNVVARVVLWQNRLKEMTPFYRRYLDETMQTRHKERPCAAMAMTYDYARLADTLYPHQNFDAESVSDDPSFLCVRVVGDTVFFIPALVETRRIPQTRAHPLLLLRDR